MNAQTGGQMKLEEPIVSGRDSLLDPFCLQRSQQREDGVVVWPDRVWWRL